jgi:uncharacterized protein with PQ loop repeat
LGIIEHLPGTIDQHWKGPSAIILFNAMLATSLPKNRARDMIRKVGMLSFTVLFASPLAALKQVVESKSAASIPLPFTIASLINCFLWSVVGKYEMNDVYILLPSVLDVMLATSLPKNRARDMIGKVGMLSFTVLFASPLAALKQVVESKSAASIPLPFTIASLINCFLWSVVGKYEMNDVYILLPSVLGLCCALVQLALKLIYSDRVQVKRSSGILL